MQEGDEVVYKMRNIPELGLFEGRNYKVLGIVECKCVHGLMIDIGVKLPGSVSSVNCNFCNITINTNGKYFMHYGAFQLLKKQQT